ncbi:DCC1-like thiol-disulfide oxidoreductase family protein [Corynebacterium sp. TAE3-ERU2]|uniref:DCC1-like thiol-disulfide oxidoreductase family protein n=1 Tax=Corynebacterium sp. TAE3-ERU2 TaxID=2849497 RepID=UPI001C47C266|nr:DCC1-like thiol-disulfide oxidoreductase family protein [Corynebacterium sp. TAE3-ERU2]MBV7303022.1 DUF393 domain-containing protein [Corynebacterium sp. TAE3-ERU2]
MRAQPVFYYDGDCGFCQACALKLAQLAPQVAVEPATPSDEGLARVVRAEITDHALYTTGLRLYRGNAAIGMALRQHGRSLGVRTLGLACLLPGAGIVYRWVARNRRHISRLLRLR